jgi:hypothetical protein
MEPTPRLLPPPVTPPLPPTHQRTQEQERSPFPWKRLAILLIVLIALIVLILRVNRQLVSSAKQKSVGTCENSEGFEVSIREGYHKNPAGLCEKDKTEAEKAAERKKKRADAESARTHPQSFVPAERPWTSRTLDIPAGGLAVDLWRGWEDHALGGNISITFPDGRVRRDEPGANHDWGWQPKEHAIHIFIADPPGSARKVAIYNRW